MVLLYRRVSDSLRLLLRSVPDESSALQASREYATHPHLASSKEDYEDAKVILKLYQDEFNISAPEHPPIFPAGTEASRSATLASCADVCLSTRIRGHLAHTQGYQGNQGCGIAFCAEVLDSAKARFAAVHTSKVGIEASKRRLQAL